MSDFEQKYLQEKRKCDNLLKMQTSIFNDVDEYSKSILKIRNCIRSLTGEEDEEIEQLTPEMAVEYADEAVAYLKKLGRPCECNRWKGLYQRESEETLKLNKYTEQLLKKIKQKEEQESKDRIQIELFKKQFDVIKDQKDSEKKKDKKQQARSKSKNKNTSQTQRKNAKNGSNYEVGGKEQAYIKLVIEKLEKDLQNIHREVQTLRDKNIELEQVLRIYRAKERKHMLHSECKWFQ